MEVKFVKIETQSQKLFREFLDGKTLPTSACDVVMEDLNPTGYKVGYSLIMEHIKRKLILGKINKLENILFVDFVFRDQDVERPCLVRMLNMTYGDSFFIVVNMKELVYIPAGSKESCTTTELARWLELMTEKHLAALKQEEQRTKITLFLNKIKGFFKPNQKPA